MLRTPPVENHCSMLHVHVYQVVTAAEHQHVSLWEWPVSPVVPSVLLCLTAWCLRSEGVSSVLLGVSNTDQLQENLGSIKVHTLEPPWFSSVLQLGLVLSSLTHTHTHLKTVPNLWHSVFTSGFDSADSTPHHRDGHVAWQQAAKQQEGGQELKKRGKTPVVLTQLADRKDSDLSTHMFQKCAFTY